MCGIFAIISDKKINLNDAKILANHARQRGKDSSGFLSYDNRKYFVDKFDFDLKKSIKKINLKNKKLIIGHSRLVTNSMKDNQPICENNICVFHNGIVTNYEKLFKKFNLDQKLEIDTEIINSLFYYALKKKIDLVSIVKFIKKEIEGSASCIIALPEIGKVVLFSNNGSLYVGKKDAAIYISSEKYPLIKTNCSQINQVISTEILDIPKQPETTLIINDFKIKRKNLVPIVNKNFLYEKYLNYDFKKKDRCTKCILPNTFPFIRFDEKGVCNYCYNYQKRNIGGKKDELKRIFEKYRDYKKEVNCIFPLSGGRDSCYGLHLAVNEFNLKPISFTYDWGLVTDLARRNISRICQKLNVENIIFADNIEKKRQNIKKNVVAWLKKPELGMVNLFTAGDKHFYRFLEKIKKQNNIKLNLWSYNPLEITHFKYGFLGIEPEFENKKTYNSGLKFQINYHYKRLKLMLKNFSYFNSSIFDTLKGEYFRSVKKHHDYYYIFNYLKWDESNVEKTLNLYNWERSPDTQSSWRIGDGAAPFYNYIYYTFAGFTEFDTFRSNQIREGDLSREEALRLVEKENQPRFPSIEHFLKLIDLDFKETIEIINAKSIEQNIQDI